MHTCINFIRGSRRCACIYKQYKIDSFAFYLPEPKLQEWIMVLYSTKIFRKSQCWWFHYCGTKLQEYWIWCWTLVRTFQDSNQPRFMQSWLSWNSSTRTEKLWNKCLRNTTKISKTSKNKQLPPAFGLEKSLVLCYPCCRRSPQTSDRVHADLAQSTLCLVGNPLPMKRKDADLVEVSSPRRALIGGGKQRKQEEWKCNWKPVSKYGTSFLLVLSLFISFSGLVQEGIDQKWWVWREGRVQFIGA